MTMVPYSGISSISISRGKGVVVLWHVNECGFVNKIMYIKHIS